MPPARNPPDNARAAALDALTTWEARGLPIDRVFAERAFQTGGVIPKLQAHREGDFIRVDDPLLDQLNGKVRSVNKRNRLAEIDLDLVGTQNRVWLGLDII